MISSDHYCDDEDVFFGEISERELYKSSKYARRKTDLFVPGPAAEKHTTVLPDSVEMEEDGPMVAGYESMSSPPSLVGFNVMTSPAILPIANNSPPAPNNSPVDNSKSPAVGVLVSSKLLEYLDSGENTPVFKVPLGRIMNKGQSPMPRECDSRLWDSGVDCGTVDCSVRSTPLSCHKSSKNVTAEVEVKSANEDSVSVEHVSEKSVVSSCDVIGKVVNSDSMDRVKENAENALKQSVKDFQLQTDLLAKQTRRSLTFSMESESGLDSEVSVQEESKASADSLKDSQKTTVHIPTTASTPRVSAMPTLDFTSPHLLVSPIAKYKTIDSMKRIGTKQSVPSSKLVLSSASAFQRVSSHQAIRRSLRKKPIDEDSVLHDLSSSGLMDMTSSSCVSENDLSSCGSCARELSTRHTPPENRHSIACIESMVTGFRNTIDELTKSISQLNERLSESTMAAKNGLQTGKSASCDLVETTGHDTSYSSVDAVKKMVDDVKKMVDGVKQIAIASPVKTAPVETASDTVLSLPCTLAGQQLQYVKSHELSLLNVDSSPDSVQSHGSTATQRGLRLSSSDSSAVPCRGPATTSSAAQLSGEILARTQSFVNNHIECEQQTSVKDKSLCHVQCHRQTSVKDYSFCHMDCDRQSSIKDKSLCHMDCDRQSSIKDKSLCHMDCDRQSSIKDKSLCHMECDRQTSIKDKSLYHMDCDRQTSVKGNSFCHMECDQQASIKDKSLCHMECDRQTSIKDKSLCHMECDRQTSIKDKSLCHKDCDRQSSIKDNSLCHMECDLKDNSLCSQTHNTNPESSAADIPFIDGAPSRVCRSPSSQLGHSVNHADIVYHPGEPRELVQYRRSKTKRKYVAETRRLSWTETGYFDSDSSSSELSDSYAYNCRSSSESDSSSLLDYSASDSFDFNPALLVSVDGSRERLTTIEPNTDMGARPASKGKLVRQRSFQEKLRNFRDKLVLRKKKSQNKSKMKVDKENKPSSSKKKNSYPKTPRPMKSGSVSCGDLSSVDELTCLRVQVNGEVCSPADVAQYKKKAPQRWRKPDSFMSLSPAAGKKSKCDEHVERITQLHTMCNGQRIVRYLNFSESPMIIKHYPPPKEAAKVSWSDTVVEEDGVYSPLSSPPPPKPILQQKPSNHLYPFVGDVPSPIILTRTRRSKTLFRKVTQL